MKIGFTGTQRGMTGLQQLQFVRQAAELYSQSATVPEFHDGDCIGAADEAHKKVAHYWPHVRLVLHAPLNPGKRAWNTAHAFEPLRDYLARNRHIVVSTDILLAAPGEMDEQLRSGTWSTIRFARRNERPIRIIFPDGSVRVEG